jgi:small subunit ribosomal protein S19
MARSVWKGPFVEESLMKKVDKYKDDPKKFLLKHGQENQLYYLIL